jgi:hypothetical protein
MKIPHVLFLPLSLILLSPAAQALPDTEISCHSTNVADAGFNLLIHGDRRTAILDEETIAGPRPLASLQCEVIPPPPRPIPDKPENTLLCRSHPAGQGGYVVRLFEGGIVFMQSARVYLAHGTPETEDLAEFGSLSCYSPR